MGAHDHANLILLEESVYNIWSVAHDVIHSSWITNRVLLHAQDFIRGSGITPQNIHAHLLNSVGNVAQIDSQGPLNFVNIFEFSN